MSDFAAANRDVIARLLSQSDDELFAQLGRNVLTDRRGAFPPPFAKLVDEGKKWFAEQQSMVCSYVCNSPITRTLVDESDRAHLALTLMGIIGHVAEPVNVACLAIILSRMGIRTICAPYWQEQQ
jgi:hypothetical protein